MLRAEAHRYQETNTQPLLRLVVSKKGRLVLVEARCKGMIQRGLDLRYPIIGEVHEISGAENSDHNGLYFVRTLERETKVVEAYVQTARKITIPDTVTDFGIRSGGIYAEIEDKIKIPLEPRAKKNWIKPEDPRYKPLVESIQKEHRHPVVIL